MTKSYHHAPILQSRALLVAGLIGLAAALTGEATYAFQSAAASQEIDALGVTVKIDALIKTALSIAAGLSVAFGAVVAAHLWRTGRKGLRKQAWLAIAMTCAALTLSVSNLSGYFAWTRAQHEAEMTRGSEAYRIALQRVNAGAYVPEEDRQEVFRGEAPADADREIGDDGKALFAHLLIAGMFAAYRLPKAAAIKRRKQRRPQDVRSKLRVA